MAVAAAVGLRRRKKKIRGPGDGGRSPSETRPSNSTSFEAPAGVVVHRPSFVASSLVAGAGA